MSGAAAAAGIPAASWASQVVRGGLSPEAGRVPARCSRRPVLWGQILERWQSASWAMVALRGRVPADEWAGVTAMVGRAGVVITSQADLFRDAERRYVAEACRVAATSMMTVGPGTRPGARLARKSDPAISGHRAKVLFPPATHGHLRNTCASRGWNLSDYVAAVTTLTAWLARAGSGDPVDINVVEELLASARDAASHALFMLATPGIVDESRWTFFVEAVADAWKLVDAARTSSASGPLIRDAGALVADAFGALGWAAPRGVGLS